MCKDLEIKIAESEDINNDTIHFEGITDTEKHFLNIVRNFRSQRWLSDQVAELVNDVLSSLVTKSLEEKAIRNVYDSIKGANLQIEDTYNTFVESCDSIVEDDEQMNKLTGFWYDTVMETIYGELKPLEEPEE